ncbi:Phospholipase A1 [Orchesella cincta]|uniref:Phospholipase A1 n=1 Tax=Orchesella cincta TaxID=48709 RepID=A0A1D2M8N8_ORCCI|nr:Phospholipase A1 [Orchesella cincta]
MCKYLTASILALVTILLTIPPNLSSSSSTFKDDDQDPNQCCRLSTNPNDIKFLLFPDERNPDYYTEIIFNDVESLANSLFQPGIQTILITHGFRSDFNSPSCKNPKRALLQYGPGPSKANIIVATWGPLSTPFPLTFSLNWYTHVLENVPIVGERIGDFIKFLVGQEVVRLDQIYLIGHSLGAHVMGIAGKQVQKTFGNNQKVGRITAKQLLLFSLIIRMLGLDPALVGKWPEDDSLNLINGDAFFIDIIHTNSGKLGMIGQVNNKLT